MLLTLLITRIPQKGGLLARRPVGARSRGPGAAERPSDSGNIGSILIVMIVPVFSIVVIKSVVLLVLLVLLLLLLLITLLLHLGEHGLVQHPAWAKTVCGTPFQLDGAVVGTDLTGSTR